MTGVGWGVLWGVNTFWNPLAFTVMWTGAALVMWRASGFGYPGITRHAALAGLSVPLWWWFELVNNRVGNWEYVLGFSYTGLQYAVFSSVAYATVIPAVIAATGLLERLGLRRHGSKGRAAGRFAVLLIGTGLILQAGVFAFPVQLFAFVWVAPFLIVDGLLVVAGRNSLAAGIVRGRWREPLAIAGAGLVCGVLWEFWNFWSTPHWIYHVPLLGFGKVFEMPILGYLGYVPFAWSVVQFVRWADVIWERFSGDRSAIARQPRSAAVSHADPLLQETRE